MKTRSFTAGRSVHVVPFYTFEPLEERRLLSAPVVVGTSFDYHHAPQKVSFTFNQWVELDDAEQTLTLRN